MLEQKYTQFLDIINFSQEKPFTISKLRRYGDELTVKPKGKKKKGQRENKRVANVR